jgi:hypothetical protein
VPDLQSISDRRAEATGPKRRPFQSAYCWGLFMKSARLIGVILAAMLLLISFVGVPAVAQQDEGGALTKKVAELYQAGKFSAYPSKLKD